MSKKECSIEMSRALDIFFEYRLENVKMVSVTGNYHQYNAMYREEVSYESISSSKYAKNFIDQLVKETYKNWSDDAENFFREQNIAYSENEIDEISVKDLAFLFFVDRVINDDNSYANAWVKSSLATESKICSKINLKTILNKGCFEEYLEKNITGTPVYDAVNKINEDVLKMISSGDIKNISFVSKKVADFLSESFKKVEVPSYVVDFLIDLNPFVYEAVLPFDERWKNFPTQVVKTHNLLFSEKKEVNLSTYILLELAAPSRKASKSEFDGLYDEKKVQNNNIYYKFQENVDLYACEEGLVKEYNQRLGSHSFADLGSCPLALLKICKDYEINFPKNVENAIDTYLYMYYGRLGGVDTASDKNRIKVDAIISKINDGDLDYWLNCRESLKSENILDIKEVMILPLYQKWLTGKINDKIEVVNNTENKEYKL